MIDSGVRTSPAMLSVVVDVPGVVACAPMSALAADHQHAHDEARNRLTHVDVIVCSLPVTESQANSGLEVERAARLWETPTPARSSGRQVLEPEHHIEVTGDGVLRGKIDEVYPPSARTERPVPG